MNTSFRDRIVRFAYARRRHAKRLLSLLIRVSPAFLGRRLALVAEKAAFMATPSYQGDTLPPMFHYWSNRYLRPIFARHGFASPDDFYLKRLLLAAANAPGRRLEVMSLGSGGASLELRLLAQLRAVGVDARMLCVDINKGLMDQAMRQAREQGLGGFGFALSDCNASMPAGAFDVIIVNQFFHHVADLESFCALLEDRLSADGAIVSSDIVGRNGHVLWPGVDAVVASMWNRLPASRRFDAYFGKPMASYRSVDHSAYSNEGIKAQEVVGRLLEHFDFELFITYGAAIVPFVERRIGFNFDPGDAADRSLIDEFAAIDGENLERQRYPGSNMLAVLRKKGFGGTQVHEPVSPLAHVELTRRELQRV